MLQVVASLTGVVYDGNIFIIQVPGLTLKHYTMLEKLAGDKHSSLLRKFAKNRQKCFIKLTPGSSDVFLKLPRNKFSKQLQISKEHFSKLLLMWDITLVSAPTY